MVNLDSCTSLADILAWRAEHQGEKTCYIYLADGERKEIPLSYGELDSAARRIASRIIKMGGSGQPILLFFSPGLDFIKAFFGCFYAGAIAVPTPLPRINKPDLRVKSILNDADVRMILTNQEISAKIRPKFISHYQGDSFIWLLIDSPEEDPSEGKSPVAIDKDTPAFLQYTSGSTAAPKGVIVSHGNIIHNLSQIHTCFGLSSSSQGVIWLPPYHDMGLIGGIFEPMYGGFPSVLMSPFDFMQKPVRWLDAVSRYGGTVSGGPNFAYDLCVGKISQEEKERLDLSSWDLAFNGAEAIHSEVLDRFEEAFKPCGFRRKAFYPCYGLAEATLLVSGGEKESEPIVRHISRGALAENKVVRYSAVEDGVAEKTDGDKNDICPVVGCGQAHGGQTVLIVNPEECTRCSSEEVGEIWVRGASVSQGYLRKPELNKVTFQAYIKDAVSAGALQPGPYLRTGDLGFICENQLYITGRIKDLIIYKGRNYYPQDLEFTAGKAHPALNTGATAAFSIEMDGREELVIVQELKRDIKNADLEEIAFYLRQAVTQAHEIPVHTIAFIRFFSIPKTTSGKIQRYRCRDLFINQELELVGIHTVIGSSAVSQPLVDSALLTQIKNTEDPALLQPLLCRYLQEKLSHFLKLPVSYIEYQTPVISLGVDSVTALELKNDLDGSLGVNLPIMDILQGATLAQISEQIIRELKAQANPTGAESADWIEFSDARELASSDCPEYPLSHGQEALWFLYQLAPESSAYNVPCVVRIINGLNVEALHRAFQKLVRRYAVLRTTFHYSHPLKTQIQRIHETLEPEYSLLDVSALGTDAINTWIEQEARRAFDLEKGPLFRIHLFKKSEQETILLMVLHHIITDFWSLTLMIEELGRFYTAECTSTYQSPEFTRLAKTPNYFAFVEWQKAMLASAKGEKLRAYWMKQLQGELPVLNMPTDFPRPPVQTYQGQIYTVRLDAALSAKVKDFAKEEAKVTLHTLLLAAFQLLVYRYTKQEDFLIGIPTTGRSLKNFSDTLGYFVNSVVIRSKPLPNLSFIEFLNQTRTTLLEALEGQDYPFDRLVSELKPQRDSSRSPLFQIMFAYQRAYKLNEEGLTAFSLNIAGAPLELAGLKFESLVLDQKVAQFDLTLTMGEVGNNLIVSFEFNRNLYKAETIRRMTGHLETLLAGIIAEPQALLTELPLIPQAEKKSLFEVGNGYRDDSWKGVTIAELFQQQVARTPEHTAVQYQKDKLTYRELAERATQLAGFLEENGVGPETCIGIYMEHSLELMVGILGVLMAGGAYLPLDPGWPEERIDFILSETGCSMVLSVDCLKTQLEAKTVKTRIVAMDKEWEDLRGFSVKSPSVALKPKPENLACIIYTSGSLGVPKGVMLTHEGITNLIHSFILTYNPTAEDKILPLTSIASASFVGEILPLICAGGTLILSRQEEYLDPEKLFALIGDEQVSIISTVPTFIAGLNNKNRFLSRLRLILSGGEALHINDVDSLAKSVMIINSYGLTETSVCSTYYPIGEIDEQFTGGLPIGRPIINTDVYVLGEQLELMPPGCMGEIFIGGKGLARGYFHNPELTGERFIAHPFKPGERLFMTGDIGVWLADGTLKYLGRKDQQVKIRGYRIELGEVETALRKHPEISDAVVAIKKDPSANSKLVAYFVSGDNQLNSSVLHNWLARKIPFYMIPASFEKLEGIPLNANGKVNWDALPEPTSIRPLLDTAYLAPENDLEQKILQIWQDVLQIEKIGINDNFFELGGNSILITKAHQRIKSVLQLEIALVDMFKYPTIHLLAQSVFENRQPQNLFGEIKDEMEKRRQILSRREEMLKNKLARL
jgi:amino acid adenylation domain-containing protein